LTALPAAQFSDPTSLPSVGAATAHKALPAAWLRLAVSFAPRGNADVDSRTATIELTLPSDRGERPISTVRIRTASDLESGADAGKLTFHNVPTQLPIWLRISVRSKDDAVVCSYARVYVLRFPEQARAARIGFSRAMEESGYLGDFTIDSVDAEITRRVSFQHGR